MEVLKSNIGWKMEKMKIHEGIGQKNKQGCITQSLLREPVEFLRINRGGIYLHVIIFYNY